MYIITLDFARSIATSPHALSAMPATSLVSWPLKKAIAPVALERAHFSERPSPRCSGPTAPPACRPAQRSVRSGSLFRAPRRRSPTRKYLVQIQVAPPFGANAVGTALPLTRKPSSWLRHSGARTFFRVSCRAEPTRNGNRNHSRSAHSDTHFFFAPRRTSPTR